MNPAFCPRVWEFVRENDIPGFPPIRLRSGPALSDSRMGQAFRGNDKSGLAAVERGKGK